ncbi:MAG: hypothetical protein MK097_17505, partial [Dechloromonas sp.]|nr:hypothetical protein [Dechloromonas sp.]
MNAQRLPTPRPAAVQAVARCKPVTLALAVSLSVLASAASAADASVQDNDRYRQALYLRETGQPYAAIESLEALLA